MGFLKTQLVNHWTVVQFRTSRLTDPMTVAELSSELEKLVATLPLRCRIAVSFAGVDHVSSEVIGLLLGLRDRVAKKHGELVLCKLGKHVIDIMRITRLDRHFTFSPSVSQVVGKRPERAAASIETLEWMD
ncbi:MAG TPA: STAS domain-containing protein [Tepidisphaeraceae bacterium]|jgi:anti-anti-sigma factor